MLRPRPTSRPSGPIAPPRFGLLDNPDAQDAEIFDYLRRTSPPTSAPKGPLSNMSANAPGQASGTGRYPQPSSTRGANGWPPPVIANADEARAAAAALVALPGMGPLRRAVGLERRKENEEGPPTISRRDLTYQPQSFVGAAGLAPMGRPEGMEKFRLRDEYGYEIPTVKITPDGDFAGDATEFWRSTRGKVLLDSRNAAHGGHVESLGMSGGDIPVFDKNLDDREPMILPIWGNWGGFSVATTPATLQKLTKYNQGADWVQVFPMGTKYRAFEPGKPDKKDKFFTMQHGVVQLHFDADGRQLPVAEAERRQKAYKNSADGRKGVYAPNKW